MASNIRTFKRTLEEEWPALIDEQALKLQKSLTFLILGAVVEVAGQVHHVSGLLHMTPVDTGRARANWQVSTGSPILTTIAETSSAEHGNPPTAGEMAAAVRSLAGAKVGTVIFITNNLPYIVPLNEGHSNQSPPGWVEQAVDNALAAFRGIGRVA